MGGGDGLARRVSEAKTRRVGLASQPVSSPSQPSGTEAEKNGYRSVMSPGGGPACARCQEASRGGDTLQLHGEQNKGSTHLGC